MKRIIAIIIMLLFSISLSGCSQTQSNNVSGNNPSKPGSSSSEGGTAELSDHEVKEIKLVKKPDKAKYLLSNGIEILNEEKTITTSKGKVTMPFPKIAGLKDKEVEKGLNKAITDDIEREIKNYADENSEVPMELYTYIELSANNLLSISLRDFYSDPICGFLYRLTDGKMLHLKDIFTEGTDFIPLVNNKVVEGILVRQEEEENYLSEPFKTIKQDQSFDLSDSNLYIIFSAGENGFLQRGSICIPLSQIDDYVDVIDKYTGTESKTQEKLDIMNRENNIFTTLKGDVTKKTNGDIWSHYPEISGLRDTAFEAVINNTIKEGIDEVINNKYLDGLAKVKDQEKDYIALIDMSISFNHYGILCIRREVMGYDTSKNLQQFTKFYSFDLVKKKLVNSKDMIRSYIGKNSALNESFTNLVIKDLENIYSANGDDFKNKISANVDYSFIMGKGQLSFSKYYPEEEMMIVVHFKGNTFKDIPYSLDCQVPFKSLIKGEPEDFFRLE